MSDVVSFKCPSCGGAEFSGATQPKSYDELVGLTCRSCGRPFSKEDFKAAALEIAIKIAKEAFKK